MVFTSYSLKYRLNDKNDPLAPQDEKKYVVFFFLMELFAVCPNCTDSEVSRLQICLSVENSTQYSKNSRKSFTSSRNSLFGQYDITDFANIQDP